MAIRTRRAPTTRFRGRSGSGRSFVFWAALASLTWAAGPAAAQLEVLLRGLDPAPPRLGACGRYRFSAEEPSGPRQIVFDACVERIDSGPPGSVWLRFVSGDSLEARIELSPELFAGRGGSLLDHVRSVFEVDKGDTTRIARDKWKDFPGLDPAPVIPGARDSALGEKEFRVGSTVLEARGRRIRERAETTRPLGNVQMTQRFERDIVTWTAPEAPLLGLVRARAEVITERTLSAPTPGVPQFGGRVQIYEIELLDVGRPASGRK